ncbi:M48 family metallopeptidase [Bosea sp. (in: a-proteobacteria)]|uniref:tetratricopeptide repeat protein n=1 Tax=Bosea sp. (in: a-proteobacteria) TaxID=1871050 RepID=UPI002732E56B|nr:hypothetical protein [Bosea sp. (in: a-proteobacteria)]MDP3407919.1 hypothetical protein [Bosea sp. (in: a-proteobacteria)]
MRRRRVRLGLCCLAWLVAVAPLASAPASADSVVVAPGVSVTRRSYDAPLSELPFFGFRDKTVDQLAADRAFIAAVEAAGGREVGYRRALELAQQALAANDLAGAARRYNQAFLLIPNAPEIYHGFAIIVVGRFKDAAYAEELFATAARLRPGDPAILADQARLFLMLGRPAEAVPLLESVVRDPQAGALHWSHLGFAYAQSGQAAKACDALAMARRAPPPVAPPSDLTTLSRLVAC